ncbi:MAG: PEP-CTERM sorting domain-containing protein [Bryobacteraceae bacterium]
MKQPRIELSIKLALIIMTSASAQIAAAAPIAFMVTSTDHFGTIDLGTGAYTDIANTGQLLSGLGVSGGSLYAGLTNSAILYQVNSVTGALTNVGSGSFNYLATGSTSTGLYGINTSMQLFSVNPSTGATALIGSTGLVEASVVSFSTGSNTLYLSNGTSLYSLNTSTAAPTLIGSTGSLYLAGMVASGGTLYGGSYFAPEFVVTIDQNTGATTVGPLVSGAQGNFYGLAQLDSAAAVPEPGALGLTLAGLGIVSLFARRNRR